MAKLPSAKRILKEDVSEAPSWINPIIDTFNAFAESIYQTLNKSINDDNLSSQVKEITYITPSTYPVMDNTEFLSELKTKATGLAILQVYEKATYTPAAGPCYAPWVENNGTIIVGAITGLVASKSYIIRIRLT